MFRSFQKSFSVFAVLDSIFILNDFGQVFICYFTGDLNWDILWFRNRKESK